MTTELDALSPIRRSMKNVLVVRAFAIKSQVPAQLVFSENLMRFTGLNLFSVNPNVVWGVTEAESLRLANGFAYQDADHHKKRLFTVDLHYRLSTKSDANLGPVHVLSTNLSLFILNKAAKKLLNAFFIDLLFRSRERDLVELKKLSLLGLCKSRPMLVHELMDKFPHLSSVIHQVELPGGATLRIATFRKKIEHVIRIENRVFPDIALSL